MVRIARAASIVSFVLGSAVVAVGADTPRSISVTGTVVTTTTPDVIVWRVHLTHTNKDMKAAKVENDEHAKRILALRDVLDIGKGDLETGYLSIEREYERDKHGYRGAFRHFSVQRSITIRQRDLKRFGEYLDKLVNSADMEVSFSYEATNIHQVREQTRLQAIEVAKQKAAAMAKAAGAKLGEVLTIQEHPPTSSGMTALSNANTINVGTPPSPDVGSETFVPGALQVRITVYATFELQ